jgi:small GTP-binding protein
MPFSFYISYSRVDLTLTDLSPGIVPTKIPVLDDYLGGGLKIGSVAALWAEIEVDASALALQTVYKRGKEGNKVVFVTTTKKPRQIVQVMNELGLDFSSIDLTFVDAFSAIAKEKIDQQQLRNKVIVLTAVNDLNELQRSLQNSIKINEREGKESKHTFFVFDSFSAYLDRFDSPKVAIDLLKNLKKLIYESEASGFFVFTQWAYEQSFLDQLRAAFDLIIELKSTSDKPVYAMSVYNQAANFPRSSRLTYFRILKPGGVRIYIPKIVVTGPFHAGKTSFIHTASKGAVSADRLGTTVALDFAHVTHGGFIMDIFGTPGQTRFDPLLEKLGGQAIGVIVFVSATDRIGLSRVRAQMRTIRSENLPYVVAVNKINLRGALTLTAIRNLMGIPARIPMIPLKAKNLSEVRPNVPCELDTQDVENVLDKIILQVTKFESSRRT